MKKLKKILALCLTAVTIASVFSGCSANGKAIMTDTYAQYDNLAVDCTVTDQSGKALGSFKLKGKAEENNFVTVDLGETKNFNTVVLKEKGKKVTLFEIYGSNNAGSDYEFLYQSDCIEGGHTCFLGDVSYRYLRIFVNQASGSFSLYDIGVYNIKSDTAKDLRVTSYLVVNDIKEDTDFSMLDGITDLILFGTAKYDKNGNIYFVDGDGNQADESIYSDKMEILRNAIGDRDINVLCDIAMPYGNDNADIISMFSDANVDHTVESIKAFVDKYNFDGFDLDYEFPNSKNEWKQLNNFLRKLDTAIPDKLISLAIAPWDLQFDEDVIKIIDRAEVMLYDMFTAHGYHSIFPVTVNGINKMLKGGFDRQQLDLGVPFYSRPTNRLGYWGNYNQYEDKLDRYTNLIYFNDFDHSGNPMTAPQYINSVQMISDKTAFAVDCGLGGIMVWHMTCDLPYSHELSLFKAINDTKSAKQN
ncbi:MAG: glycoside hydrolase family 18 protein [Eubacteriales bacterium]|nr:glycoside hydrolase family 18 protein [Eubacteriales bacterium]